MMMMPASMLTIGNILLVIIIRRMGPGVMIAALKSNFAEREMVVIARHTRLVLDSIKRICHASTRKSERQHDAKHRAKPKERKARKPHHGCQA